MDYIEDTYDILNKYICENFDDYKVGTLFMDGTDGSFMFITNSGEIKEGTYEMLNGNISVKMI